MAKQARWNSSRDGKILASLFENALADPRSTKAADIDPVKTLREEFKDFADTQFRNNYKTTATNWMAGKAIAGTRLKHLSCEWRLSFKRFQLKNNSNTIFTIPLFHSCQGTARQRRHPKRRTKRTRIRSCRIAWSQRHCRNESWSDRHTKTTNHAVTCSEEA